MAYPTFTKAYEFFKSLNDSYGSVTKNAQGQEFWNKRKSMTERMKIENDEGNLYAALAIFIALNRFGFGVASESDIENLLACAAEDKYNLSMDEIERMLRNDLFATLASNWRSLDESEKKRFRTWDAKTRKGNKAEFDDRVQKLWSGKLKRPGELYDDAGGSEGTFFCHEGWLSAQDCRIDPEKARRLLQILTTGDHSKTIETLDAETICRMFPSSDSNKMKELNGMVQLYLEDNTNPFPNLWEIIQMADISPGKSTGTNIHKGHTIGTDKLPELSSNLEEDGIRNSKLHMAVQVLFRNAKNPAKGRERLYYWNQERDKVLNVQVCSVKEFIHDYPDKRTSFEEAPRMGRSLPQQGEDITLLFNTSLKGNGGSTVYRKQDNTYGIGNALTLCKAQGKDKAEMPYAKNVSTVKPRGKRIKKGSPARL